MYKKIGDYGIIGDMSTAALVGLDGSVDWLCMPRLDSPSVFAALLDSEKGGRFQIRPERYWDSRQSYVPETNVLLTEFRGPEGILRITDFMPPWSQANPEEHTIYRKVEALEGDIPCVCYLSPRPDYGRRSPRLEMDSANTVTIQGAPPLFFTSLARTALDSTDIHGSFPASPGTAHWFRLSTSRQPSRPGLSSLGEAALAETLGYWRHWSRLTETGRSLDPGPYKAMLERSSLVLKLLSHRRSGAIAAAATTSLPELVGGGRNWDYRYCWVRDASFTLQALFEMGHLSEIEGYLKWITGIVSRQGAPQLQIMYGLGGETELPEQTLDHLDGYKGSRPVRIGNAAASQRQMDIYGELMEAALLLSDYVGKIDPAMWPHLASICDHVAQRWEEPDYGIWEVRDGPRHFTYSKLMCWVALDRGLTIAKRYGFEAPSRHWKAARQKIREQLLEKGWSEARQSFVQSFGSTDLDASSLLIPATGFLPYDDPRVLATLEAIEAELGHEGLLLRYLSEDGIEGGEGRFLFCTFWLIDNLVAQGRLSEAELLIARIEKCANHLGLFAEEYDPYWDEPLGNFPQAFTHIGYINSVTRLLRAKARETKRPPGKGSSPPLGNLVLNQGPGLAVSSISAQEMARKLKETMNTLRGAFFDKEHHRVAYEEMRDSQLFHRLVELAQGLAHVNPMELSSRQEKLAFWINLYNVEVIHGVIALRIRDSVKETRGFFKKIRYRVGEMEFTPDDIEHGILRGNRRPPYSILRPFRGGDPRRRLCLPAPDPRIHFALVCASSSCPPIGVYTPEAVDDELDLAARTFINSGGVVVDKEGKEISLSRVFKWYAGDFGHGRGELLRFLARFVTDSEAREFLLREETGARVTFQPYDWRLNRY